MYRRDLPKLLRWMIVLVMISGVICRGMCLSMAGSLATENHHASPCGMVMPAGQHDHAHLMGTGKHWVQVVDATQPFHFFSTCVFALFWLLELIWPMAALPSPEPCLLRFPPPRLRYMRFQE